MIYIAGEKKSTRKILYTAAMLAIAIILLLCAAVVHFRFRIDDDLIKVSTKTSQILKQIMHDIQFLSRLSIFRNAIQFSSSASLATVLEEYLEGSSAKSIVATIVTDGDGRLFSIAASKTVEWIDKKSFHEGDIVRNVKQILADLTFSTENATQYGMSAHERGALVIARDIRDGDKLLGKLVFLVDLDQVSRNSLSTFNLAKVSCENFPTRHADTMLSAFDYSMPLGDLSEISIGISSVNNVLKQKISDYVWGLLAGATILFGVIHFVISILSRKLLYPLSLFTQSLERLAHGEHRLIEINSSDFPRPFAKLASHLNQIVSDIQQRQIMMQRLEREAAIVKTSQMLAHDVRKPFSMMKGMLMLLSTPKDLEDLTQMVDKFIPEIDRALVSVNGLIQDVMEVGATANLKKETVDIENLIDTALHEQFHISKDVNINLRFDFHHTRRIDVDVLKASRIFSNIIANAIEVMHGSGTLWFRSKDEIDDSMNTLYVQICIGNSDSVITTEDLNKIFEPFFTKAKPGGTGLGLAIVNKIVTDHGGKIWCCSSEQTGTEFFFTLPASNQVVEHTSVSLPTHSAGFADVLTKRDCGIDEFSDKEKRLETEIINTLKQTHNNIKILVADDEVLYQNVLKRHIEKLPCLAERITLELVNSAEDALTAAKTDHHDIIIIDVDFGKDRLNGFDAAKKLKQLKKNTHICIHSNYGALNSQEKVLQCGADLFMLKPMTRVHLLNIIHFAVTREAE